MNKIIPDVYTYNVSSTENEIVLTKSVIKDSDFSNKKELSEEILKLPLNEQIHIIHCILDTMYKLSDDSEANKKIESFLALHVFDDYRKIIMSCVDYFDIDSNSSSKISDFENKYNIKIVVEKE